MSVEGVIGAAIGFAVTGGNPAGAKWGYAIGSAAGSVLNPDVQKFEGPRLDDLTVIDSSYGKDIPYLYGTDRITGNIIWAEDLEEVKIEEESGGKGGPKSTTTTYEYYATFALGLCAGEITGISRIWINNKLIYKISANPTAEEILASNAKMEGITVYTGSETQDPNPTIQAAEGVDATPAFRGLAYLFFDRLEVTDTGGIPNIEVEVVKDGTFEIQGKLSEFALPKTAFSVGGTQRYYPVYNFKDGVFSVYSAANLFPAGDSGLDLADYERVDTVDINGNLIELGIFADNSGATDSGGDNLINNTGIIRQTNVNKIGVYGGQYLWLTNLQDPIATSSGAIKWGSYNDLATDNVSGYDLTPLLVDAGATGEYIKSAVGAIDTETGLNCAYIFTSTLNVTNYALSKYYKVEINDGVWTVSEQGTVSNGNYKTLNGYGLTDKTTLETEDYLWYQGSYLSNTVTSYGEKTGTHWQIYSTEGNTFNNASNESGLGGGRFSVTAKDGICVACDGNNVRIYSRNKILTNSDVTLASIVTDICERAGLDSSEIDVTDLTDTVYGYTIAKTSNARSAIEPLMRAFYFDGAEFGGKLNFVKRGGAVAASIPEEDLGVSENGDAELYVQTRAQEFELPSELVVSYKDKNRDQQVGSQRSRRINTNQTNVVKIQSAISMSANYAKRNSEILLYNAWTERDRFKIFLSSQYIDLNPTDVIRFTAEGDTRKARIAKINYGSELELDLVSENSAYTSTATAADSESVEQTLGLVGPTNLQLLDIPLLRNSNNDTGIYLAASGYFNGWMGARIYKSTDDVSYSEVDAIFTGATQGYTTNTLADANHTLIDRASSVTVKWTAGTAPGSITESNAIKGARYFLIGDEIVTPINETDNGNGSYTYDTFIRGLRGTDWATGTHATSDRVIILTESVLSRLEVVLSTARYFKGVSIGNYLVNADSQTFTNTGVSLKPFSPTYIRGTRDGSNNLTVTWLNRSRYIGGALQSLPLFEDSESYKVEILDAPGGSVLRTISSITSKTTSYSAANQTADGLTPGDPIDIKIYQYSNTVGYGYGKEATV